ncbi:MAG: IucA/IucC family protein [Bacteroidota bacterium]
MKNLVIQLSILRLIYSAYRERIFIPGHHSFLVKYQGEPSVYIHNQYDVLDLIYTRSPFEGFELALINPLDQSSQDILDFSAFWEEFLIPNLLSDQAYFSRQNIVSAFRDILLSQEAELLALKEKEEIYEKIRSLNPRNMWEMLLHQSAVERSLLLMQFASLRGNPTHPLAKLKKGFEASDIPAYSPENAQEIKTGILAVAQGICKHTRMHQSIFVRDFFAHHYPEIYDSWKASLERMGHDATHYFPLPYHPYQSQSIKDKFPEAIEKEHIIFMEGISISLQATMSVRTLMPYDAFSPFIKLPLNIQTTSMLRTHSPPRVHAGPVLSRLLEDLLEKDPVLGSYVKIMPEPLGIYVNDEAYLGESQNPSYHLNVLYKENPLRLIADGEICIPLSAALELSPCTSKALFIDIMEYRGINEGREALAYFTSYAENIIYGQLGLYAKYGIAMEAHQQNCQLVFSEAGEFLYSIIGDLAGGIEIYEPILAMNGIRIKKDMHPTKKHIFEEGEIPEQQILHTTFNYHLIPLSLIISKNYGLPWQELLQVLVQIIKNCIDTYRTDPSHLSNPLYLDTYLRELDRIEKVMLTDDLQVRSLLRMSLGMTQKNIYTSAENIFSRFVEEISVSEVQASMN